MFTVRRSNRRTVNNSSLFTFHFLVNCHPEQGEALRTASGRRTDDLQPLEKGDHWIDLALGEFPLFVKKNHAVPLCPGGESSELLDDTTFTLLGQIEQEGTLSLYRDDGTTTDPDFESGLTQIALVPDKFLSRIVNV